MTPLIQNQAELKGLIFSDVTTPEDLTTSKVDTTTELLPENTCTNITIPNNSEWYSNNCTVQRVRCPHYLNFQPETRKRENPCTVHIQIVNA